MKQGFLSKERNAVAHPSFAYSHDELRWPKNLSEWKCSPTVKLEALIRIIQWHLHKDNRPALVSQSGKLGGDDENDKNDEDEGSNSKQRNKIVVFQLFIRNNERIQEVIN
jgi:hypothetical protein